MSATALSMLSSLPPVIERYELKYVIPRSLVEPISQYVSLYCLYDRYSMEHADRFYPVNSLYFDTPNYRFLKQRMWGADRRFNMRVRAYGDGRQFPYFAEIKFKTPTCVRKFRAHIADGEWPHFLRGGTPSMRTASPDDPETPSRELFLQLGHAYAIEPKIFTCYKRRAFFSLVDDYARVTFDIDMRYRPQNRLGNRDPYSLSPDGSCINYDCETIYDEESRYGSNVILELKASVGAVPLWMIDLIQYFELKQVGFSKYLNSSLVEHQDNGWHYMEPDRISAAHHNR